MSEDYLQELEFIGFTARIKRLSDSLIYDARKIYKNLELDIEPNWHLIFLLLKKKGKLSITGIAKELGFSHPAIIKIIKKMKEKGYVSSISDENDNRKQFIQLTKKSFNELPQLEQHWDTIQQKIEDLVSKDFLTKLNKIEHLLENKSLFDRVINDYTNEK